MFKLHLIIYDPQQLLVNGLRLKCLLTEGTFFTFTRLLLSFFVLGNAIITHDDITLITTHGNGTEVRANETGYILKNIVSLGHFGNINLKLRFIYVFVKC